MKSPLVRVLAITLLASFCTASLTSCGPIQRSRHFKRSIVYFSSTPIAQHRPSDGGRASWYLITHPESSIPYLEKRIGSEDIAEAGTAIILLQAISGKKHREELIAAIEARDWSQAPGTLSEYVELSRSLLERNEKGMMEE